MNKQHTLTDDDVDTYTEIGIAGHEVVWLRWPSLNRRAAERVLREHTTHPDVRDVHDVADQIAALPEDVYVREVLDSATIRFWQCPDPAHANRRGVVTVTWTGGVARCTVTGCDRTSIEDRVR